MSVPTHELDPLDGQPCQDCAMEELRHELVAALEAAGVKLKYAHEIADSAVLEAACHMEDDGYAPCAKHRD